MPPSFAQIDRNRAQFSIAPIIKHVMFLTSLYAITYINASVKCFIVKIRKKLIDYISISDHNVICSKASEVDRVHIVGLTFVISRIFLRRGIDLHFALDCIIPHRPFVHLDQKIILNLQKEQFQNITWKNLWAYNSIPSLNHVISGRGKPVAMQKKVIFLPNIYSSSKWLDLTILAPCEISIYKIYKLFFFEFLHLCYRSS